MSTDTNSKGKNRIKPKISFNKTVLIALLITTFLSVGLVFLRTVFLLDENQILYLFSAMLQAITGVFGLTLTAFVFFSDKLGNTARENGDVSYYDASVSILNRCFNGLKIVSIICGSSVLLCLIGIIALHNRCVPYMMFSFLINESVSMFIIGIASILYFGVSLVNPNRLEREIGIMKNMAEEYYHNKSSDMPGEFEVFLKNYNRLEKLILDFATTIVNDSDLKRDYYPPRIIQAIKVLFKCEIINAALADEINQLRMYRNGMVHGVDFSVSQAVCDRVEIIHNTLQKAYDAYRKNGKDSNEWKDALNSLYLLSKESPIP